MKLKTPLDKNSLNTTEPIDPMPLLQEVERMLEETKKKLQQKNYTEASQDSLKLVIETRLLNLAVRSNIEDKF